MAPTNNSCAIAVAFSTRGKGYKNSSAESAVGFKWAALSGEKGAAKKNEPLLKTGLDTHL